MIDTSLNVWLSSLGTTDTCIVSDVVCRLPARPWSAPLQLSPTTEITLCAKQASRVTFAISGQHYDVISLW
jgi:hypothetical protein